jgi:hypothetical protein
MQTQNDTEMKTFTVDRDGDRPLRFTGTRLATARSSSDRARDDYSGQVGIREILELYQSQHGDYIAARTCITQWQGKHDTYEAIVSASQDAIVEFFGFGWLAMEIFAEAEWDIAEDLDAISTPLQVVPSSFSKPG